MQIIFSNGKAVHLALGTVPLANVYHTIYKHLQHVAVPFRDWDNPFYLDNQSHNALVKKLVEYAHTVCLSVDQERCLAQDQHYFNTLHKIYEKNYQGDPAWLDFHEHIHLCEKINQPGVKILHIDYREKSGLLEKTFDPKWMHNATTKIQAGDVFVKWSELGKTPYTYWKNNEPNDIARMGELIKPWLKLRPKILVALEDIDLLQNVQIDKFESWWAQYKPALCKHWQIADWTMHDIFAVSVFGQVPDFQEITTLLQNNVNPVKVQL